MRKRTICWAMRKFPSLIAFNNISAMSEYQKSLRFAREDDI